MSLVFLLFNNYSNAQTCFSALSQPIHVEHVKLGKVSTREEVGRFFRAFEESDLFPNRTVAHGIMTQTSWLKGYTLAELEEMYSKISGLAFTETSEVKALILQTSLLTGSSLEDVVNYYNNFADQMNVSAIGKSWIMMAQTAYLSGANPQDVVDFHLQFPRTVYTRREIGYGVLIQAAYLGPSHIRNAVMAYFRNFPYEHTPTASKAKIALAIQTAFFAERAFLPENVHLTEREPLFNIDAVRAEED